MYADSRSLSCTSSFRIFCFKLCITAPDSGFLSPKVLLISSLWKRVASKNKPNYLSCTFSHHWRLTWLVKALYINIHTCTSTHLKQTSNIPYLHSHQYTCMCTHTHSLSLSQHINKNNKICRAHFSMFSSMPHPWKTVNL